jgi:hypothetical protein
MKSFSGKRGFLAAAAVAAVALVPILGTQGCGSIDPGAELDAKCPPFQDTESFRPVSAVLERRCGTLDCHGSLARPLRLYGQYGLRRYEPPDSQNVEDYSQYYPGGKEPTTIAELNDNYRSICGLEPALMTEVVDKKADPEVLTLVRKARLREKHKGGLIWNKGDNGDVCLTNWLTGGTDTTTCDLELGHP